jgi:ABC-type spermidine/putrescine transport system permease subunit II
MAVLTQWRDGIFARVAMHAVRKLAYLTFVHMHELSLRFHLERKTGGLTRVLERGRLGIEVIVRMVILQLVPTIVEVSLLMAVLLSPMIVPVVVVGVGMYLFFAPLGLANTYTGLIAAHAALGVPFVVTTVAATLQGFNQNLVRASLSLGANPVSTFFRVTLPVIAPGVMSGALFAFATSFDEVVVTLFLAGADQTTLPRQMFTGIRENISPTIAALATILIVFSTSLLLALEWLRGRNARRAVS